MITLYTVSAAVTIVAYFAYWSDLENFATLKGIDAKAMIIPLGIIAFIPYFNTLLAALFVFDVVKNSIR